jgi:hypothetical protein
MGPRRKSSLKISSDKPTGEVVKAVARASSSRAKNDKVARLASPLTSLDLLLDSPMSLQPSDSSTNDAATVQKVEEAKSGLGRLESEVISALFPSNGLPESFESIAIRLGMSVKEVKSIADNALRSLRGTKGLPARPSSVWN